MTTALPFEAAVVIVAHPGWGEFHLTPITDAVGFFSFLGVAIWLASML